LSTWLCSPDGVAGKRPQELSALGFGGGRHGVVGEALAVDDPPATSSATPRMTAQAYGSDRATVATNSASST